MTDRRSIGIFDSGIGGLTVFREVARTLPDENIVYFGDTARVPYGPKSKSTVIRFSIENAAFLLKHDVKLIVVACNTSSSLALTAIKKRFSVPIIGVIKAGASAAAAVTKNKRVGVIGTRSTVNSGVYRREIEKHDPSVKVISRACPLLVPLVEEGWLKHRISMQIAREYLAPLKRARIDTLILGCTHYPLLKTVLRNVLGKGVILIDSAKETAEATKKLIIKNNLLRGGKREKGSHRFFVSDEPERFTEVGRMFLGTKLKRVRKVR